MQASGKIKRRSVPFPPRNRSQSCRPILRARLEKRYAVPLSASLRCYKRTRYMAKHFPCSCPFHCPDRNGNGVRLPAAISSDISISVAFAVIEFCTISIMCSAISFMTQPLLFISIKADDPLDVFRLQSAIDLVVDHNDRRKAAAAKAARCLKGKQRIRPAPFAVRRQRIQDTFRKLFDIARRTHTSMPITCLPFGSKLE